MNAPFNPSMFEPEPTPNEKALWDKFVEEYTRDFNAVEACIRVGFVLTYAIEYSKIFLSKPYIQRKIMDAKSRPPKSEEDKLAEVKALIDATLRECMLNGQPATRAVAAKAMASIHGLDQSADKSGETLTKLVESFRNVAKALPD